MANFFGTRSPAVRSPSKTSDDGCQTPNVIRIHDFEC